MKRILSVIISVCLVVSLFPVGLMEVSAATTESNNSIFTYTVSNGEAEITDCDTSISGDVEIPSILGDCPVTSIGDYAFCNCDYLKRIELPENITMIESYGNDSLNNTTWVYEQSGLPNHEYDSDCDNICNLCEEIRVAPNHISSHICSNDDCSYTRVVTKEDLQAIMDEIPDEMQLDIPEIECYQVGEIVYSKIKEVLERQNYKYEDNGTSLSLKAITADYGSVEITVNGVIPVEWLDIYSTSIFIDCISKNSYEHDTIYKGINLLYSNSHEHNQDDEAYIKNLVLVSPGVQEIAIDKLINGYSLFDCIKEYYTKQIKDDTLQLEIYEGIRGCHDWVINDITSASIAIFKDNILYDTKGTPAEFSVPVINVPYEMPNEEIYDYVVGKITELDEEFGENITSIEKVETIFDKATIGGYIVFSGDRTGYVIIRKHVYDNVCDPTCNLCGQERNTSHNFGNWWIVISATTQTAGLEKHVCTSCGHEETRAIAKLLSGTWKHDGIGWWYQNANGTYPANSWKAIDNVWYYFNASGYMVTGWQSIGGTWYYFAGSGAMVTGWQAIGGTWYYFAGSGAMATGWQLISGTWYYFAGSGAMVTGWQAIGGTWYYFAGSGAMVTGWQFVGGVWYYFAGSGAMVTGWQFVDGVWYYFEGSGAMVANRWVGNYYLQADGSMATNKWIGIYYVGADGAWIP